MNEMKDIYTDTKKILEAKYKEKVEGLRKYFDLSDTLISELGYLQSPRRKNF